MENLKLNKTIPWNKGLTKKTDSRLDYIYPTCFSKREKHPNWKGGLFDNPKEYKHRWYFKNKEKLKPIYKKYYQEHKKEKNIYTRKYLREHPEKKIEYYKRYKQKNYEKEILRGRKYRLENYNKELRRSRLYYQKHKKECLKSKFEWKNKNKNKVNLYTKRRRHQLKANSKLTLQLIQQIYEDNIKRFGTLTCYLCLQPIPFGKDHLEHRVPVSKGGTNNYENLAIACQKCNCSKHTKTESEFRNQGGVF